jgi:hypothetical protein
LALEDGLCGRGELADLVLRRLVVPQRAEVHEAPRIAAPVVLRVRREGQHRSRHFLSDALLEHALVRLKRPRCVVFDLTLDVLTNLVVDRLEAVGAWLADLGAYVLRHVELGLDLRITAAPFVV